MSYAVVKDYYRREHFAYFRRYKYPFYNLTFHLNIKKVKKFCKKHNYSLNTNLCYLFTQAMGSIEDFRYRLRGDDIVLYDRLHMRILVPHESKTYTVGRFHIIDDIHEFNNIAKEVISKAFTNLDLSEESGHKNFVYFSALPQVPFTSLTHVPEDEPSDAAPKVSFGQFQKKSKKLLLPVGIQVNHIFIEGRHLGALVAQAQRVFNEPEKKVRMKKAEN